MRPSYHCRITDLEGTGDLAIVSVGTQNLSAMAEVKQSEPSVKGHRIRYDYTPGTQPTLIQGNAIVHHLGAPAVMPTRASQSTARHPRWHKVDLYCQGDRVKILWDDKKVLEATKLNETRGRIQLCSQGAEIFFRNITLEPLRKPSR